MSKPSSGLLKLAILAGAAYLFFSHQSASTTPDEPAATQTGQSEAAPPATLALSNGQYDAVCEAAIAYEFDKSVAIMKIDHGHRSDRPTTTLHYIRKQDRTRWSYECMFSDNQVIWRTLPGSTTDYIGRWRDGSDGFATTDNRIYFAVHGKQVDLTVQKGPGGTDTVAFHFKKLS